MIRASILLLLLATPVQAQTLGRCAARDFFVKQLAERYGEQLIGQGLTAGARLIEIFVSGDGETWTILLTTPRGSCMVAAGEDWRMIEPIEDQEGEEM